jgi:hypothetical protein
MSRGVLMLFLVVCSAFGQRGTGEIRLTVVDAAGAPMPARADLVSQSTHTEQSVDTAADGRYSFKNLPFGVYRLLVTRGGFVASAQLIEVRSELPLAHTVTMGIQPIATELKVTEADTLIDPDRSAGSYYVGARQVKERETGLPGRDMINLVAQQPGWVLEANGVLHPRGSEYDTQYVVNGFPVQDNRSPAFAPALEFDDIQSMKAYTGGIPAEFGRKVGGVIEVTTDRNSSAGFHGLAAIQGGSFGTAGAVLSGQFVQGRTTTGLTADGFQTDRYLDPPVTRNVTNHGSGTSFSGSFERDLDDANRVRFSAARRQTWFQVPNELLQEMAGQRQDRTGAETALQASYQHVFSPAVLGAARAMYRDVGARLWSNPLSTPISAEQDRGFREVYFSANLSGNRGRHEWKVGGDADFASIRERFGYRIVAYRLNNVRIFDRETPPVFDFAGRAQDREQSAYVQDVIRLGSVTVSAGLRFDHYRLLVDETAFSPRLGVSWHYRPLDLVLRASYDRVFGTPPFENILLSAAPSSLAVGEEALYLPLRPSRGHYYEAGLTKAIARRLRLDASVYRRDFRNFGDDDVFLNTGVTFPVAVDRARIWGFEAKLDVPKWGPFSGYLSYSNMVGVGQFPITGGLFLEEDAAELLGSNERYAVTQDQRNTVRGMVRWQVLPRLWTSWGFGYNSGLPIEELEGQSEEFLAAQYGADVVAHANFERGRVRPSMSLNASFGVDLWKKERRSVTVQADILNVTDRLNVINFAGLFSGTALAQPRSFGIRLRTEF